MKRIIGAGLGFAAVLGMALAGAAPGLTQTKTTATARPGWVTSTMKTYDPGKWTYWGGDAGQTRYVPIDQINAQTVNRLKIAWRWSADNTGAGGNGNFKSTPFLVDGVLYTPWVNHGMAAIDAGTGKTIWTFEPQPVELGGRGASLAPRSLAYWSDGKGAKRLFHNSLDGRLICVDATIGKACPNFGTNGWINLRQGIIEGTPVTDVGSVSPAIVVGDVVVTQMIPGGTRNKESAPGKFRGHDVRTGKLVWTFNPVPQPGEFGNDTWKNDSWKFTGNTGSWTMMSADPELGYVYLATDTPSNDFSGVERPGDNLFAESIVCLNAKTGKRVWHFQTVHHGIWDYDNPAAPILHDIVVNGKRIKAVTQLTKQGFLFVFDRTNGKPVWPIEERPVPPSKVPGEQLSPTQPFPTKPLPITNQGYKEEWLVDFTPELRAEAVEIMKQYAKGPIYTPLVETTPTLRGTLVNPGFGGGANWNGAAFDPTTGMMYVPVRMRWSAVGVTKGNPANTNYAYTQSNNHTVAGPKGLPIMKPPYAELVAIDMNRGEQVWRRPVGSAPDSVRNNPALKGLNLDFDNMGQFDIRPGPLLIKDLIFMGESGTISASRGGEALKAYDKKTGRIVWQMPLPTLSTGAPMTYLHKGRQYIVIAVSAPGKPAEYVALTLDGQSENGAPPAGGVLPGVAPVSTAAAAAAITATPAELALGKTAYDKACAVCHSADGSGGIGPKVSGRTDYANIARVIAQGQGEMPAMANSLTNAEMDAIAKYVIKTWPPAAGGRGGPGGGRGGAGRGGGDD